MTNNYKIKGLIGLNGFLLLLMAVGFGIFFIVTPKYYDDYWYMWDISGWFSRQGIWYPTEGGNIFKYGIPWNEIGMTVREHLHNDMARLCNVTAPFLLLFPKWMISSISLIAFIYTVTACFRLTEVNITGSWLVAIGIGLWTLTFMWYDTMGDIDYQVNYIWSGALCLIWLSLLKKKTGKGVSLLPFLLLTLLVGLWHEGFSAPLFVSLLVVIIFFKRCRNIYFILASIIFLLCMIWHFGGASLTGSSTFGRATTGYYEIHLPRLLRIIFYHRAIWVMVMVSVIYIVKQGFKRYFTEPLIIFMLTGIIVALGQNYLTDIARAAWWGDMACVIMVLFMIRNMEKTQRDYSGWRGILSGIILFLSFFELTALDIHTFRFADEYPKIIRNYLKEPSKTQFSELIDYPWQGLMFAQMIHLDKYKWSQYPQKYYGIDPDPKYSLKVVPASLRNIREEDLQLLEGNMNVMKYGPYILAPGESEEAYIEYDLSIDYGTFRVKHRVFECIPFISESTGKKYLFMDPLYSRTEYRVGNIKGIWKERY